VDGCRLLAERSAGLRPHDRRGSVFDIEGMRVTRGFEIHCDLRKPNNIQVNWEGNRFHLDELTAAICTDTLIDQTPPKHAPFDTFFGTVPVDTTESRAQESSSSSSMPASQVRAIRRGSRSMIVRYNGPRCAEWRLVGYLEKGNLQTHRTTSARSKVVHDHWFDDDGAASVTGAALCLSSQTVTSKGSLFLPIRRGSLARPEPGFLYLAKRSRYSSGYAR